MSEEKNKITEPTETATSVTAPEAQPELSLEEQLMARTVAGMSPEVMGTFDEKTRAELEKYKAEAETKPAEPKPEEPKSDEPKPEEPAPETAPAEPEQPAEPSMEQRLADELTAANSRYNTLKGKYNVERKRDAERIAALEAELKAVKEQKPPKDDDGDDFNFFDDDKDPDKDQDKKPQPQIKPAEQHEEPGIAERLSALEAAQLTEDLDRRLRASAGIGIAEFDAQPWSIKYMTELVNENGITAAEAIEQAKARRDNAAVAAIATQVVDYMKSKGAFRDDTGKFPTAAEWKSKTGAETTKPEAVKAAPTAVMPHATGAQTATSAPKRTRDVIERELDDASSRAAHGDPKAVAKLEKLTRELLLLNASGSN